MEDHTFDHLPALQKLQQYPQWVLWKYEERDGKPTKVPYNAATRKRAAADNPATWASYATARATLTRFSEQYDGLGFVFESETVPLTGVDLDHCVNSDGSIDAWAQAILGQLASYAEYSPSGTGIHVYVKGTVSHGFHKKVPCAPHAGAAVEMYSTGRYFTVTGEHVPGTPETIADGADALAALSDEFNPSKAKHHAHPTVSDLAHKLLSLSDEELLAKARAAKNGEKFWALWNGDISGYLSLSEADQALCTMLAFWTGRDARRIDHLFRHSKIYRPEKWDRNARAAETYGEGTIARAIALCDTVYNPRYQQAQLEREIERLLHTIAEQHAQRKQQQHPLALTPKEVDLANILSYLEQNEHGDAYFFAEVFEGQVCYDHSDEAWYLWGGHAWKKDLTNQTRLLVSGVLGTLYLKTAADLNTNQAQLEQDIATRSAHSVADKQLEALKEQNRALTTQRSELTKRANALRGAKRNTNVLSFVKPIMGVTADIWDTDPWLLAVPNGVIDLRTGTHRDGFPGDYMRTVCPTEWAGLASPCPRFEQFLQELFADRAAAERAELIAFLHRLFGYGITGITSEAIFPIFYGEQGRNGKDTLLGTLKAVLGSIVGAVSNDVFIARSRERAEGAATPHLCDLQGKRLVWGSELKPGERLNIAQIKLLSGGGDISTRQLHGHQYSFTPTHKMLIMTNYKPRADADEEAFWARACLVEFNMRFVDHPHTAHERLPDYLLKQTLLQERSGILAWLVRGCLAWQHEGSLAIPQAIRIATDTYRREEDILLQFIQDRCTVKEGASVRCDPLFEAYKSWSERNHFGKGMNKKHFGERMTKKFPKTRDNKGIVYSGLELCSSSLAPSSSTVGLDLE